MTHELGNSETGANGDQTHGDQTHGQLGNETSRHPSLRNVGKLTEDLAREYQAGKEEVERLKEELAALQGIAAKFTEPSPSPHTSQRRGTETTLVNDREPLMPDSLSRLYKRYLDGEEQLRENESMYLKESFSNSTVTVEDIIGEKEMLLNLRREIKGMSIADKIDYINQYEKEDESGNKTFVLLNALTNQTVDLFENAFEISEHEIPSFREKVRDIYSDTVHPEHAYAFYQCYELLQYRDEMRNTSFIPKKWYGQAYYALSLVRRPRQKSIEILKAREPLDDTCPRDKQEEERLLAKLKTDCRGNSYNYKLNYISKSENKGISQVFIDRTVDGLKNAFRMSKDEVREIKATVEKVYAHPHEYIDLAKVLFSYCEIQIKRDKLKATKNHVERIIKQAWILLLEPFHWELHRNREYKRQAAEKLEMRKQRRIHLVEKYGHRQLEKNNRHGKEKKQLDLAIEHEEARDRARVSNQQEQTKSISAYQRVIGDVQNEIEHYCKSPVSEIQKAIFLQQVLINLQGFSNIIIIQELTNTKYENSQSNLEILHSITEMQKVVLNHIENYGSPLWNTATNTILTAAGTGLTVVPLAAA
jgi:hypothetical protein